MPYIDKSRRDDFEFFNYNSPQNPGELNYLITRLVNKYIQTEGLSYATINDIVGAIEGAKLEFYRRVVAPYEDEKIKTNGDVY